MHREEVMLLAAVADRQGKGTLEEVLPSAGVPEEMISTIRVSFSEVQKNFRKLEPDTVLSGGETIATSIGTLQVIWTPGHSPGHVCLYSAERRLLFSGDQILEHISPNIGWQPNHDALAEFLRSLDRLAQLEVDLILPSHGAPFSGHRQWIRKTVEHHAERCDRIVSALMAGAKSAHELVGEVWKRPLSPFHYRFAIFEVLAHLEYLKRLGRVRPQQNDGVCLWLP